MEKVTGIGGFFFRSNDPESTGSWYKENLGIDIGEAVWSQQAGPTVFHPFEKDTDYFGRPEQQWMINLRVNDMDAMIEQLGNAGISAETRKEWDDLGIGRFARIIDPEGNPVELWEPPENHD